MKDFTGLVLCDWKSQRVDVHVKASLSNGELTLSGQDLGPYVEEVWGDLDYEYWYSFDRENTKKLLSVIHGEEEPDKALLHVFSGTDGCIRLREVCEKSGIEYDFFSYARLRYDIKLPAVRRMTRILGPAISVRTGVPKPRDDVFEQFDRMI